MAGLSFAATFTATPADRELVAAMAAAAPHRGPARVGATDDTRSAGAALGDRAEVATDGRGRLIVADSRLDEVARLARRLRLEPSTSEAALILAAFDRWDTDSPDELLGDFAFVIWDAPRERVFAARDIFGTRPLFYARSSERVVAASELAQLVESGAVPRRADERTLIASLAGRTALPGWTTFERVRRVRPGYALLVDGDGARTRPFWRPPKRPVDRASGQQYVAELRELVRTTIGARLRTTAHPGLMLSGGIDSASIAAVAAGLRAEDPSTPALATYSWAYEGFPEADERESSRRLCEQFGLSNIELPTDEAFPLADFGTRTPDLDGPEILQSHVLHRNVADRAHEDGVELMMSGHRSDPLFADGVFDYLGVLRSRGPFEVVRQARQQAEREQSTPRRVLQRDLVRRLPAAVWPRYQGMAARDYLREVIPGGVELPPWIHPEALAQHELAHAAGAAVPASRLAGEARRRRHESIIATNHATSAEYLERLFARSGIRYADPWSDRRLADWVLAIPTQRITVDGTDKWVLREAMRGTVPDFARLATRASNPSTFYWYGVTEGAADAVRELLSEPRTAARGWVDAGELERAYARYQDGTWPGLLEWGAFWRWLSIEQWLRAHDL